MVRKTILSMAAVALCSMIVTPAMAQQDRVSATEKGSLLYYPKVEVRWVNEPPYEVLQDTFVHITNDYPDSVSVKMYFVNGDAPIYCDYAHSEDGRMDSTIMSSGGGGEGEGCDRNHPGWNYLDNIIELTQDEPAYWSAATGQPKGVSPWSVLDPGPGPGRVDPDNPGERVLRGFIVAFAIDQVSGNEIRWNHLAGDATIVHYSRFGSWQYNADAFQVVSSAGNGEETGSPGEINMDGAEYAQGFSHLLMNFIASGSTGYTGPQGGNSDAVYADTALTLMPIDNDFRQEGDGPVSTKVTIDIWNQNEVKFTNLDRCITCWDMELLSNYAIPNHFLVEALQTDVGKARFDGVQSQLCPGPDGVLGTSDDSVDASLLGLQTKILYFGGEPEQSGDVTRAGSNLHGLGLESGSVSFDSSGPPPESNWEQAELFMQDMMKMLQR